MNTQEAIAYFDKHGSFCRTGNGTTFALEAFSQDPTPLYELAVLWGGSVVKPPPAAPKRWTWRLYGKAAIHRWYMIRPFVNPLKVERGDRKLGHCKKRFDQD